MQVSKHLSVLVPALSYGSIPGVLFLKVIVLLLGMDCSSKVTPGLFIGQGNNATCVKLLL